MRRRFALVAVLGGLVLASYVHGISTHESLVAADALWGTMPRGLRGFYEAYMFVAAVGFFPPFVVFMRDPEARYLGRGNGIIDALYVALLVPSAAWMGLTFAWLSSGSTSIYALMRADLFVVAAASYAMLAALVTRSPRAPSVLHWSAVVGQTLFTVQTGLLDPIVWPLYVSPP